MQQPPNQVTIRLMKEDDKDQVRTMVRRSFHPLKRLSFTFHDHIFVAAGNDGIVFGLVVLQIFTITPNRPKTGKVSWILTDPQMRGLKLGQQLIEKAIEFFKEQGCDQYLAVVEGHNTSSAKLFSTRGFGILSPGAQLRRFGLRIFPLWIKLLLYLDVGFFLWGYPQDPKPDSPKLQWAATYALSALTLLIIALRIPRFGIEWWFFSLAALAIHFGARHVTMLFVAKKIDMRVRFRMWESGFALSIFIATLFAGYYPIPGNLYPDRSDWRHRDTLPQLGRIALGATISVLVLTWGSWFITLMTPQPPLLPQTLLWLGRYLLLFDAVFFFFPFIGYNARRLWDWNKCIWLLIAVAAILVMLV